MFADADPDALEGKSRAAFRGGFLGVASLGWSTLVQIVEAARTIATRWSRRLDGNSTSGSARPTSRPRARRRKRRSPSRPRSAIIRAIRLIAVRRTFEDGGDPRSISQLASARHAQADARLLVPRSRERRGAARGGRSARAGAAQTQASESQANASRRDRMADFWLSCGHHLLDRDDGGGLLVTDEFLKAYLARPELAPPPNACVAERTLARGAARRSAPAGDARGDRGDRGSPTRARTGA